MASEGSTPTGALGSPTAWAATIAAVAVCIRCLAAPAPCVDVPECASVHEDIPRRANVFCAIGLAPVLAHEMVNLISTYRGVRETKALAPELRSRCLPSLLLCVNFAMLLLEHTLFAVDHEGLKPMMVHAIPPLGNEPWRPIYSLEYLGWITGVPLLMVLAGHCSMGRPLREVARPLVVTDVYVLLTWWARVAPTETMRLTLVGIGFLGYFWASWDMVCWAAAYDREAPADLPSRSLRPVLGIGLILDFSVYAVVFLSGMYGLISPTTERLWFVSLDVGTKLAFSIAFVVIRAEEYHRTLTGILKKVHTSNVGMLSILRGSFDALVPCTAYEEGDCWLPSKPVGDLAKLEAQLARPLAGTCLNNALAGLEEREHFAAYVRNTVRQADRPIARGGAGGWTLGGPGGMPPVAQVLHCLVARGVGGSPPLRVAIHLSVVPRTGDGAMTAKAAAAAGVAPPMQLVAAVQFEPESGAAAGDATGTPHFGSFDAHGNFEEEGGYSEEESSDTGSGMLPLQKFGLVATLGDVAKLGTAAILGGGALDTESSYSGSALGPRSATTRQVLFENYDDNQSAISGSSEMTALLRAAALKAPKDMMKPAPVLTAVHLQLFGLWQGSVSEAFGGWRQVMRFKEDGCTVEMEIVGRSLTGRYSIDTTATPYRLDLQVCQTGEAPSPPIPYIFKFEDRELHLCCPCGERPTRPKTFQGPGHSILRRGDGPATDQTASGSLISGEGIRKEDRDFSRRTTAEPAPEAPPLRSVTMPKDKQAQAGVAAGPERSESFGRQVADQLEALKKERDEVDTGAGDNLTQKVLEDELDGAVGQKQKVMNAGTGPDMAVWLHVATLAVALGCAAMWRPRP